MIRFVNDQYDLLVAQDGLEALELLEKYRVSLIILDINMRNLDGIEVCRRLNKDSAKRNIPVIISSGCITDEYEKELTLLGVKYFLRKPYPIDTLLDICEKVLKSTF